ncbi:MAG: TatD family hydrolase [Candidatus Daviesbacteria bacterium]|nr:TatD family hydrolase [Candidatus Daviesbacteria bacterium]
MLVDTHAHLYWDSYQTDLDQVLNRAKQNGLGLIINIGTDLPTSLRAITQAKSITEIPTYATVGLHPHEGATLNTEQQIEEEVKKLEQLYIENKEKVVAIGECGLDFFFRENAGFNHSELSQDEQKTNQRKLFKSQIQLAKKLDLPLVIHCRDGHSTGSDLSAWSEIFISELEGTIGVFHNFSGTLEDAKKALSLGYYLSFSCVVTYPKNQYLRDLIKDLPLDKIVTETDCPFLPPQQIRGQRNEPFNVAEVVKTISEIKQLPFTETAKVITENAQRLFGI